MAILKLDNGKVYSDREAIAQTLASLKIDIKHYPLNLPTGLVDLLDLDILEAHQKQQLLAMHKKQLISQAREERYAWCDLLLIHPGLPSLQSLIFNYGRYHVHATSEAWYILSGSAIFGIKRSDASPVQVLVQPGDYIHIPSQVEHWFSPTGLLNFKAVRYFASADSWIPYYSEIDTSDALQSHLDE
jgi:1,2-dihydroxy-3-keto-5-methylthiopentene dioxygenase